MKVIITGGTRGIGRAIAMSLLDQGFEVNVLARTLPPDLPESAVFWRTDLRLLSATLQTVDAIGTPSVLVNAAGFMNAKTAMEYDDGEIQDILAVNLINTVKLSLHVAKSMAKRPGGGRIGHPDLWYAVVLWLATLAPTYLSGDCIDLNNGMNVR